MKGIGTKQVKRWVFRGVARVGKAAPFCLGLPAMLALVVVMVALTAVMLIAAILPATVVRQKRDLSGRRDNGKTSVLSAPRKAVAS